MSALVTSDTGIRPTCGTTYFVTLAFQSWACLGIWVQTRSAASANVGMPWRGASPSAGPARASLRLTSAWARRT